MGASVQILHRRRFHPLPAAEARQVAGNAWQIRVDLQDPALARLKGLKRSEDPADWDGTLFLVDGVELEGSVGSASGPGWVQISAWGG